LEAHLKREAAKQQKEAAAAGKKAEAERKKEAKKATKVSFSLSTKNCKALTTACTTAEDVLQKANNAGLATQDQVKKLSEQLEIVDGRRKDCVQALGHISKNPKGELAAFEWNQCECTLELKDLGTLTKEVRKIRSLLSLRRSSKRRRQPERQPKLALESVAIARVFFIVLKQAMMGIYTQYSVDLSQDGTLLVGVSLAVRCVTCIHQEYHRSLAMAGSGATNKRNHRVSRCGVASRSSAAHCAA